jgi:hypothetical protein
MDSASESEPDSTKTWNRHTHAKLWTVPASLAGIPANSFTNAHRIQQIVFEPGSQLRRLEYETFGGGEFVKSPCIPASVEFIWRFCFVCEHDLRPSPLTTDPSNHILSQNTLRLRERPPPPIWESQMATPPARKVSNSCHTFSRGRSDRLIMNWIPPQLRARLQKRCSTKNDRGRMSSALDVLSIPCTVSCTNMR